MPAGPGRDGLYLPMTFVKDQRPSTAAAIFFTIVDAALRDLVQREKWDGFEETDRRGAIFRPG
jgi:hypothetical protein